MFYFIDNAIPIFRLPVPIFSGRNLIKEPSETIQAHGTPKHSNQRPDNCIFFPVVIWLTNPPKHGTPQTYLSRQTYIYSLLLLFPNKCE